MEHPPNPQRTYYKITAIQMAPLPQRKTEVKNIGLPQHMFVKMTTFGTVKNITNHEDKSINQQNIP